MKKFIFKTLLFFGVLFVIVAATSQLYKQTVNIDTDYMAAIIDKHNRLQQCENDRLLLVSGSSMAFGINSEVIEKELNVNVVNLALQAGLGCDFILSEVSTSLKKGDIVLLGLEYQLYDDDYKPNVDLINYAQKLYEPARDYYQIDLPKKVLIGIQNFRKCFSAKDKNVSIVYNRKSFNKYGDVVGHLGLDSKYISGNVVLNKMKIKKHLEKINELYLKCQNMDADLYIIFPCFPRNDYFKNEEVINSIYEEIKTELPFIKVLNDPVDFIFDESDFFDTEYHLNSRGREIMTQKLETILKSQVFKNDNRPMMLGAQ